MASSAVPSPARSTSPAPLPAPPNPNSSSSGRRRPPPPCWTDDEIRALIDSYRDKWYALRRGNLRASHWQDVSDAVAGRRCHRLPSATPKTAVQCRHKIEKLRKRYRSERQRSLAADPSAPPSSSWILFRKLDSMERGGAGRSEDDDDDEEEDDDEFALNGRRVAGSERRIWENGGVGACSEGAARLKPRSAVRRSRAAGSVAEERAVPNVAGRFFGAVPGKGRDGGEEGEAVEEMVSSLRMLGERFLRMEQMKMEQAREMERARMEAELKRTEVIMDSQRRIVDAFVKGLVGKKRARASPES